MKQKTFNLLISLLCLVITCPGYAAVEHNKQTSTRNTVTSSTAQTAPIVRLREVLLQAQANDPIYRQAKENYQAAREALPQSLARYLPHLQVVGSVTQNRDKTTSEPAFSDEALGIVKYPVETYSLNVAQTLFNYKDLMLIKEAQAIVKQAYYRYIAAYQELVTRNAKAYLAVLHAQNEVEFAKKKRDGSLTRLKQAKERLRVGMIAMTVFNDAEAAYDRDVALVLNKENELSDRQEDLRRITGLPTQKLAGLKANIPLISANPQRIEHWEASTIKHNVALRAAHYGTQAAKQALESERAGHLPVVNAIATLNKYREGSQGFGATAYIHRSAGVEFTFPLIEGGAVLSLSRQAQHDYEAAAAKEEEIRRIAVSNVRKAFLGIELGIAQIKADAQAIRSANSALASNEAAFRVGMRNIVDVIEAERNVYAARVAHSQDQIDYIMHHLSLSQAAGTLSMQDIDMINSWLN